MQFDVIVIGSGIAGMCTALAAAPRRVALLTRGELGIDGASCWAQGGIAAALHPEDSAAAHARDTLAAGNHLNDVAAVQALTIAAPAAVRWLDGCGVAFDRDAHGYRLGREAAHSRARIVHALGDATGAAVMQALRAAVAAADHIQVLQQHQASALLQRDGHVVGVAAVGEQGGVSLFAPHTVLATGGIGALYRYTTNPDTADASGLALASAAGAELADLEFVQFHPTALRTRDGRSGQLPLLTEALRGAGAVLINGSGKRFMCAVSRDAELAPRDVVARAVWQELERHDPVFLDATRAVGADFPLRFPTVFASCQAQGLDPRCSPIPVVPAQHYHMGGIKVDETGASTLPGLYAVGEVACSGVHGANRLASNSLLEGLVFGRALGERLAQQPSRCVVVAEPAKAATRDACQMAASVDAAVRDVLWRHAGLVRDAAGMQRAIQQLQQLQRDSARTLAERQRIGIALALVQAALKRADSIGAHFRRDAVEVRVG